MDQVILVDENDNEVGVMDKVSAHKGKGKLHRASSVFLFNTKGELLLQQRSKKKITCKSMWANTCCGNLRPGEDYEECAMRRLWEELGIGEVKLAKVTKFLYQTECDDEFSENEIDTVYIGKYDGKVKPNPDEVNDYQWIRWDEFRRSVYRFVPWLKCMEVQDVLGKIERKAYE